MAETSSQINNNIARILVEYYSKKSSLSDPVAETDPFDKAPPKNIRSFSQETRDVSNDTLRTARPIGDLIPGKSRLNLVSALTKTDRVDFFKFKNTTDHTVGLTVTTDKTVRVQLLKRDGTILADSEATSGDKKDNFGKLTDNSLKLAKGDYYIKVTRSTGATRDVTPNYAIQVSSTRYFENDYDTTEKAALKELPGRSAVAQSAQQTGSLLNQMYGGVFGGMGTGEFYNKQV